MTDPNAAPDPAVRVPPVAPRPIPPRQAPVPDPGTRTDGKLATILAVLLVPLVVVLQQCDPFGEPPPSAPRTTGALVRGTPETDQFSMIAKLMVKVYHSIKRTGTDADAQMFARTFRAQLEDAADPAKSTLGLGKPDVRATRLNRLRVAIAAGEMQGGDEALELIDSLAKEEIPATPAPETDAVVPGPDRGEGEVSDITPDLEPLRLIYSGRGSELSADERSVLAERHGWWGRLALSHSTPDAEPARAALIGGGGSIVVVMLLVAGVFLVASVGAIVAFIVVIVKISSGQMKRRFVAPAPGGSVYMETVVVFILCFLAIKVGGDLMARRAHLPEWTLIAVQWLLVLVPLWPLLRGVSLAEHRRLIGWHSGRGVVREIGAGILGYFAGLVPFFFATMVSFVILLVKTGVEMMVGKKSPAPHNPVLEELMGGGMWQVLLFASLATIWAPIVEEAVFRGSLFRHLRSRRPLLGAAVISALVFGFMHQYPFYLLLPVITLGFVFAMLREWRGSLIAPMTAHALHNGTLVLLLALVLWVLKD